MIKTASSAAVTVGILTLLFVIELLMPAYALTETSAVVIQWKIANPYASGKEYSTPSANYEFAQSAGIVLRGCRGEKLSTRVLLTSSATNAKAVTLVTSDLKGSTGIIRSEQADVRIIKDWYQAESAGKYFKRWSPQGRVLVPELLLKDTSVIKVDRISKRNFARLGRPPNERYVDISEAAKFETKPAVPSLDKFPIEDSKSLVPVDISRDEQAQYWIDISLPPNVSPGEYFGYIDILSESQKVASIPLRVRVWTFDLANTPLEYSIYYRGVLSHVGSVSSEAKNDEQYRAELRNLVAHGISSPTLYQPLDDFSTLRRALSIRREERVEDARLYFLGIKTEDLSPSAVPRYLKMLKRMQALKSEFSINKIFVYGIDEAPEDQVLGQMAAWTAIRSAGGGVFAAGWTGGYGEKIGGAVDVFVSGAKPSKREVDAFHRRGTRVFLYNQPQSGVEDPELYRRRYGIELWREGYDGAMVYAYQHGFGSVWNDFDHREFRDHNFTYPTISGVVDTIEWEGFAAGIIDTRYIASLVRAVHDAERTNSGDESDTHQENRRLNTARDLLKRIAGTNIADLVELRYDVASVTEKIVAEMYR